MNRVHGAEQFSSRRVDDNTDGYSAVELFRTRAGTTTKVARVVFWDAWGQFTVETLGTEVPLVVLEELIAEARTTIKTA